MNLAVEYNNNNKNLSLTSDSLSLSTDNRSIKVIRNKKLC